MCLHIPGKLDHATAQKAVYTQTSDQIKYTSLWQKHRTKELMETRYLHKLIWKSEIPLKVHVLSIFKPLFRICAWGFGRIHQLSFPQASIYMRTQALVIIFPRHNSNVMHMLAGNFIFSNEDGNKSLRDCNQTTTKRIRIREKQHENWNASR